MKKALAIAFAGALFAGVATAQVELDLDGAQGNGPDALVASVSDYITLDIWILGPALQLISANVNVCDTGGNLEYQSYAFATGWATNSVDNGVTVPAGCVLYQSADFSFTLPLVPPFLHGTATYHVADATNCGQLVVTAPSGWLSIGFGSGFWANGQDIDSGDLNIDGSCDPASVQESSWGAVKELFR